MDRSLRDVSRTSALAPSESPVAAEGAQTLRVAAVYSLSEAGRKASLLAGGDGRAHQRFVFDVAVARLHLVTVDANGFALLKLQPWYRITEQQQIVRYNTPPVYDAPPTIDDLLKTAARNHELERTFTADRSNQQARRREDDRELRAQLTRDFLANPAQRAMVHPAPSSTRCFLATPRGRMLFDQNKDEGIARDLPSEAHRRFRADLSARRERNLRTRAEQLALHQEKKRLVAEWTARNGSPEQQQRQAAGVLPMEEVVSGMEDEAFAVLAEQPRYLRNGVERLQAHLRKFTQHVNAVVGPGELAITRVDAVKATADQWAFVQQLQSALPDATVTLREHRLSWQRDRRALGITVFGAMVARKIGPFTFRREFAAPGGGSAA